ncbi:MAG: DNA-directed RNA polymerase subunit alpha C-terminal domain-containing protein, partial [Anaerolineae bacterium]
PEPEPEPEPEPAVSPATKAAAAMALADLGLSTRVTNLLEGDGITTVDVLIVRLEEGEATLLAISGIGEKAIEEIRAALAEHGLNPGS